jgi:hypothetical protein
MALWAPFVSFAGEEHIHPDDVLLGVEQARCLTWPCMGGDRRSEFRLSFTERAWGTG